MARTKKKKRRTITFLTLSKDRKKRIVTLRKRLKTALFLLFVVFICIIVFQIKNAVNDERHFRGFNNNQFSDKYFVRGVDVSHHNVMVDWNMLREQGVTFAYLKSTEGVRHKDREYRTHYKLSKRAALKVGSYHFYTFALNGKKQAAHFIKTAKVQSGDMIPAIDVEHSSVNKYSEDMSYRKKVIDELKALENALFKYYGKHPMIYTNNDGYKLYVKGLFPKNPLWISDLNSEPSLENDQWTIWQFSHTGQLQGVSGDIDLNYYRHSFNEFQQLWIP